MATRRSDDELNGQPTSAAPLLSVELLEQLAARWRAHDLPIADALRPGLSDTEMDEIVAPLGVTLPGELRTWWGWHDGADGGVERELAPRRIFLPLHGAVEVSERLRNVVRRTDGELGDWRDWIAIIEGHLGIANCGVAADAPVCVRYWDFEIPDSGAEGVPSLGALVLLYIDAFDSGAYAFDRQTKHWKRDIQRLDARIQALHLG